MDIVFKGVVIVPIFIFFWLRLAQFVDIKLYIVISFDACNFGDFIIKYIYTTQINHE